MLLPDLKVLPNWLGHRSIGAFLIDTEVNDRETLSREHKILKDLRSGKKVSVPRMKTLVAAILRKWQPSEAHDTEKLDEILREWEQADAPLPIIDFDILAGMMFWKYLGKNLPETHEKTRRLLEGLAAQSLELQEVYLASGCKGAAMTLKNFAAHPSAGDVQGRFLYQMVNLLNEGKEEIARVELAAFGAILVSAVFLLEHESDQSKAGLRDTLAKLFAVEGGRVNPLMSFSYWMHGLERLDYPKDELLRKLFIDPGVEDEKSAERDPRNEIRNSRRYRNGDQVPSFHKIQAGLSRLGSDFTEEEHRKWESELEQVEFGVLFALLVANSARSIMKIGGVPERPCQTVFDMLP